MDRDRVDVITYYGEINDIGAGHIIDFSTQAKLAGSSAISLHISSPGGSLSSVFAAYYHLRALGVPLITHNLGNVDSAAIVLFLAADTRRAAPFTTFLIHECTISFAGDVGVDRLRETLKTLEFDSNRYAEVFDERTQKGFDVRACLSGAADRMSANDAMGVGLLTEPPIEPAIPAKAFLWTIKPA